MWAMPERKIFCRKPAFRAALGALLGAVRLLGNTLPDDELVGSDVILPNAGASLAEVRDFLAEDGLIPG